MGKAQFRAWLGSEAATQQLKEALAETRRENEVSKPWAWAVELADRRAAERERVTVSGTAPLPADNRPEPDERFVVGRCPLCNNALVSNYYRVSKPGGIGYYLHQVECWGSLQVNSGLSNTCSYRRTP